MGAGESAKLVSEVECEDRSMCGVLSPLLACVISMSEQ